MADEIIRLDYSAEDIGDNIDEVRTARGEYDSLDDRLDNIEGGGPSPSNPIASNCVSPMTGYSKSSSSTPGDISTSDTLNAAIGKLEKRTELNENNISLIEERNPMYQLIQPNGLPRTYNPTGATVTVNADNSVTVNATNSHAVLAYAIGTVSLKANTTYVCTGAPIGSSDSTYFLNIDFGGTNVNVSSDYTFTSDSDTTATIMVYVRANIVCDKTFYPMIVEKPLYDAGFTTYQPYAMSNVELTSKALRKQTILSTNDDFNLATSNGMYKFNGGPANNPAGSSGAYGILLVITFDNYTMQLCYDFVNGVYYRNKVSSWSAWTKFN